MGGKILEFKGERIFREGEEKGERQGKINELIELVYDGDLDYDMAARKAENKYGIKGEDFKKMLDAYSASQGLMEG